MAVLPIEACLWCQAKKTSLRGCWQRSLIPRRMLISMMRRSYLCASTNSLRPLVSNFQSQILRRWRFLTKLTSRRRRISNWLVNHAASLAQETGCEGWLKQSLSTSTTTRLFFRWLSFPRSCWPLIILWMTQRAACQSILVESTISWLRHSLLSAWSTSFFSDSRWTVKRATSETAGTFWTSLLFCSR